MTDNKMRYTIDQSRPHPFIENLFLVLDRGQKTEAYAGKNVKFSDECNVQRGYFYGGYFYGGRFSGGYFYGGRFSGGYFYGGRFSGGRFYGGYFRSGDFYCGTFHGGYFYGGRFSGGTFRGGRFYGGYFRSGDFYCGTFHGGRFRSGWLPLQIRGSRHFVNIPDGIHIRIGCLEKTPEEWAAEYSEIGIKRGYTSAQIEEYRLYIDLATKIINHTQQEAAE